MKRKAQESSATQSAVKQHTFKGAKKQKAGAENAERLPIIALLVNPVDATAHSLCIHFAGHTPTTDILDVFAAAADVKTLLQTHRIFKVPIDDDAATAHEARFRFRDCKFTLTQLEETCTELDKKARQSAEELSGAHALCFVLNGAHAECKQNVAVSVYVASGGAQQSCFFHIDHRFCSDCTFAAVDNVLRRAFSSVRKSSIAVGQTTCKLEDKIGSLLDENKHLTINYKI